MNELEKINQEIVRLTQKRDSIKEIQKQERLNKRDIWEKEQLGKYLISAYSYITHSLIIKKIKDVPNDESHSHFICDTISVDIDINDINIRYGFNKEETIFCLKEAEVTKERWDEVDEMAKRFISNKTDKQSMIQFIQKMKKEITKD